MNTNDKLELEKYRAQKAKARERQAEKRKKRRASGEILVQIWAKETIVTDARHDGYIPAVVWMKQDEKIPEAMYSIGPNKLEQGDTPCHIFVFSKN